MSENRKQLINKIKNTLNSLDYITVPKLIDSYSNKDKVFIVDGEEGFIHSYGFGNVLDK
jgi:hypothetical protein